MKILIPTSITLDEEKLGLEPGDTVRHYNPTEPIAEEDTDAEVLIAWANTADQLADSARRMKNVGLIQALLAGPDAVRAAGFTPDAAICAGVGLHSKTVAEHALALTLNFVRFLPTLAQATVEHRWAEELGGAQELHPKDQVTTLLDANVLVWGFGSIAGAALDVTATEPLPSDSPLWDAKNIVITPHAAGGRPVNPEELIAHNIRAFRTGAAASEYRNRF